MSDCAICHWEINTPWLLGTKYYFEKNKQIQVAAVHKSCLATYKLGRKAFEEDYDENLDLRSESSEDYRHDGEIL